MNRTKTDTSDTLRATKVGSVKTESNLNAQNVHNQFYNINTNHTNNDQSQRTSQVREPMSRVGHTNSSLNTGQFNNQSQDRQVNFDQ